MTEKNEPASEAKTSFMSGFKPEQINKEFIETRLKELWEGKINLVHCFWIYMVAVTLGLSIVAGAFGGILGGLLRLIALAWSGFMVMPVIRSADKFTGDGLWALLAKIAAILTAISVAASLLSLAA